MSRTLANAFVGSSLLSAVSAGLNLIITILTVRWFGTETYANYVIDLAWIGLLLLILEIVPSNYSVFRVQDEPDWQKCVAAQTIATACLAAIFVYWIGSVDLAFRAFSPWMPLYAATMAVKRYLDTLLQSSGRLREYMAVEVSVSAMRGAFITICYFQNIEGNTSVWGSLAAASVLSQLIWFLRNPAALRVCASVTSWAPWRALLAASSAYPPYYLGIALKRLKDNIVPLSAEWLLRSHEVLSAFFLAYRGVVFAVGQVRILEAMMNHRLTLKSAGALPRRHRYGVAAGAQILGLAASAAILVASGVLDQAWSPALALSFMVWPIVFLAYERARAYSRYRANDVNAAIIAYLAGLLGGSVALDWTATATPLAYACLLVLAEVCGYLAMNLVHGTRYDSPD